MFVVNYPVALAAVFIWIGMVCAISFMEAWLKFRAPGVTLELGLGIGKLVFKALLYIEWVMAAVVTFSLVIGGFIWVQPFTAALLIPVILLAAQYFWLLPALNKRTVYYTRQEIPPRSYTHIYYVAFEFIKIICLFLLGSGFFML